MFLKRKKFTVNEFANYWFLNKYSIYNDLSENVDELIKKFGNTKCISKKMKELSYYDIFNFIHKKMMVIILQDKSLKNFDDMDIHKDAILVVMNYDPSKPLNIQSAQVYVYKHKPFAKTILLFSPKEVKKTFKIYNTVELSTGRIIDNFNEIDDNKDYIFISKKPLVSHGKSSYVILRYSPNSLEIDIDYSNLWPFI